MLTIPLVLGIVLGHPTVVHIPLILAWYAGYFAFYATGVWLKSGRKSRYFPPVRAYAIAAAVPVAALLIMNPYVAIWAAPYAPLLAVSLYCSHRRADRSLLNDTVTVVAATLMLPLAWSLGQLPADLVWQNFSADVANEIAELNRGGAATLSLLSTSGFSPYPALSPLATLPALGFVVWQATALLGVYFLGTVFYVKTMIRERGSRAYYAASVGYHVAAIFVPFVLASGARGALHDGGAAVFAAFFTMLAARAVLMPQVGGTPRQVGVGELVASGVLMLLVLMAF